MAFLVHFIDQDGIQGNAKFEAVPPAGSLVQMDGRYYRVSETVYEPVDQMINCTIWIREIQVQELMAQKRIWAAAGPTVYIPPQEGGNAG